MPRSARRCRIAPLGAVLVEDPVAEIHLRIGGRLDHQHLVTADPETTIGQAADQLGIDAQRLRDQVEHDEIVAQPVHLGEAQQHRQASGGSRFSPRTRSAKLSRALTR